MPAANSAAPIKHQMFTMPWHNGGLPETELPARAVLIAQISDLYITSPHGVLDAATVAWLDGTLATSAARPALLFLRMSIVPRRPSSPASLPPSAPAGEQAVTLKFEPRWPEVFKIEPQAPHLHAWFPGEEFGSVVSHSVPIGEFPGPYSYGYADTAPQRL
jgi:hypothetical protein